MKADVLLNYVLTSQYCQNRCVLCCSVTKLVGCPFWGKYGKIPGPGHVVHIWRRSAICLSNRIRQTFVVIGCHLCNVISYSNKLEMCNMTRSRFISLPVHFPRTTLFPLYRVFTLDFCGNIGHREIPEWRHSSVTGPLAGGSKAVFLSLNTDHKLVVGLNC